MAAARRWLAMTRLLWDALGDVPDRRGRQGRQYELRSVLGDRPGCDAGGSERSESDLALGSPAAAGSTAAVRDRERAISLPRQLSLLLPGSRRGRLGGDARTLRARRGDGRAHRA